MDAILLVALLLGLAVVTAYLRWRWRLVALTRGSCRSAEVLVLDTSAIIDGRVFDLVELTRDHRPMEVPAGVMAELEHLARSSEEVRQQRGQRGLEILAGREATSNLSVHRAADPGRAGLHAPGGIDRALCEYCEDGPGRVLVSLDRELIEEAERRGIACVALERIVLCLAQRYRVGDLIQLQVTETGRRPGQGVGTLADGTRVVVEDGAGLQGNLLSVRVSALTHTRGGQLLFARRADAPGGAMHEVAEGDG